MTFKTIAIKNFKNQLKKYLSYFLCSSFSIMIFFMYSILLFNDEFKNISEASISLLFMTGVVSVFIFSAFFINFAHSSFIKSRQKEFGIYMSLGMNRNDIRKIVLIENLIIIISSFIVGIFSGLVFSRFFQIIVVELLNIEGIHYILNYKSFSLTFIVFLSIFIIVILLSMFSTRKLDISEILKSSQNIITNEKYTKLKLFIGILFIILSTLFLIYIKNQNESSNFLLVYLVISLFGIYLAITNLTEVIISFIKNTKNIYYKNILLVTGFKQKINLNKKIFFVISVLSSVIIFFTAMPISMYLSAEAAVDTIQKNHIEFIQIGSINNIDLISKQKIEFISPDINNNTDEFDLIKTKPVISVDTYNKLTNSNIKVKPKMAVSIVIEGGRDLTQMYKTNINTIEFIGNTSIIPVQIKENIKTKWISSIFIYPSSVGILLNDNDYNKLKNDLNSNKIGTYNFINFKSWKETEDITANIKSILDSHNENIKNPIKKFFPISSKIVVYDGFLNGFSLTIFITTLMGILFFIALCSILYFKHFTEIDLDKEKYLKLYRIGITKKEITKIIYSELVFTFFVPIFFGLIPGICLTIYMNCSIVSNSILTDTIINSIPVILSFIIFQIIFYVLTRHKYKNDIVSYIEE